MFELFFLLDLIVESKFPMLPIQILVIIVL